MNHLSILSDLIKIAEKASEKVLEIYRTDFTVEFKEDESPLTTADIASHNIIEEGLRELTPDIPILSEESANAPWSERQSWTRFWLVDPIDGTKEFTHRRDEFTVNIALIENGSPVIGVVFAPALGEAFWGVRGGGAWKRDKDGKEQPISVSGPLPKKRVVASKSHLNEETRDFIEKLGPHKLIKAGSSLKFCRIAEGIADIYPRLGPTCEWDTGAAHAVLVAAGGTVKTLDGKPLGYGKRDLLNPYFIAASYPYSLHP